MSSLELDGNESQVNNTLKRTLPPWYWTCVHFKEKQYNNVMLKGMSFGIG
jgi:hypothetical protein